MKILAIGDSCTDVWVYGFCDRICPEAPVPVFQPLKKIVNKGMTGNIVNNVKSLGHSCDVITNRNDIIKTRYVDTKTNQMIMRLDENDAVESSYNHEPERLKEYDVIIISDYNKGFLDEEDIRFISLTADCLIFLQTNKILDTWCLGIDFIKINEHEYKRTRHSLNRLKPGINDKLIVTIGSEGCIFREQIYPAKKVVGIKSMAGAGDTFLSALAIRYAISGSIDNAIDYGQECATEVIQKHGVSVI